MSQRGRRRTDQEPHRLIARPVDRASGPGDYQTTDQTDNENPKVVRTAWRRHKKADAVWWDILIASVFGSLFGLYWQYGSTLSP